MRPDTRQWWDKPARVLLINLREGDEPKIDAHELVREVQSFGATAFCVSGGGILAFYQTRIAGQNLSSGLNGRDLLGEIIPVAHAQGIQVLARIDCSCAPKALVEEHPEWFARDRDGNFSEVSGHYVTCPNAGYYHGRMAEVVREILTRVGDYGADGIWNNQGKFAAWDTDACFCDTCRSSFKAASGHAIPLVENWEDPLFRRYNEWRYERIAAWVAHMHKVVHDAKRDAVFISAVQLMESLESIRPGGWDIDLWLPHQDIPTFECQRRNTAPWWPGIQAKYLASIAPDKPRWMTVSYFYPWWRLYATPQEENRPWIAQQFANGVASWLHINGGYSDLFDRRGLAPMREVFQRLARWEKYFDGARSDARVALVFSRYTQDNHGRADPGANYLDFIRGWYCALQEAHIPFDVISDKHIDAERLARYRAVVISNLACVADETSTVLEAYVTHGGGLIASHEAGFFDCSGERRARPAFAMLVGGTYEGKRTGLKSSYAKLEDRADPLLANFGDTDLIPNDGALIELRPAAGSQVPLTLIPPVIAHDSATISIPDLSGVRETTDIPIVIHRMHGRGRVVYFANQMESLYYHYGFRDLGLVLANAVRHVLGDAQQLEVGAPDFVDVTLMRQPARLLVHLINLPVDKPLNTGWRHPGRNLVPVSDIRVKLKFDPGLQVREVRLANDETTIAHTVESGWASVTVPKLIDHEIVVFEFDR